MRVPKKERRQIEECPRGFTSDEIPLVKRLIYLQGLWKLGRSAVGIEVIAIDWKSGERIKSIRI